MSAEFMENARRQAEEAASQIGCTIYDMEFVGGNSGRILRVYIDKDVKGGASIEDCSIISRSINEFLDTDTTLPDVTYHLEVSTPGLERNLREPRHFAAVMGQKISVKTFAPLLDFNSHIPELGKAKTVRGKLLSYDEAGPEAGVKVTFEDDERVVFVPAIQLTKAHVAFDFEDMTAKPKPGGPKGKKNKKHPHKKAATAENSDDSSEENFGDASDEMVSED